MVMPKDEWDEVWDSMAHTSEEYRREIQELRGRIWKYLKTMEELRIELHAANADWIKAQHEIQELRERLQSLGQTGV